MSSISPDKAPPLLLREVTIRGFRSLDNIGPLPIQMSTTVFTGQNDGGKTATLDAIQLLLEPEPIDDEDVSHWVAPENEIEVKGIFVPITPESNEKFSVRALATSGTRPVRESLDHVHKEFGAHPEELALKDLRAKFAELDIPSPGGREKEPFVVAAQEWIEERPVEELEQSWRPISAEDVARLPRLTRFASVEAPSPTAHIQGVVGREARRLLGEEPYAARLQELSEGLESAIDPSLDRIRGKIEDYCPDLDALDISALFDFARPALELTVSVKQRGRLIDLEKVGEGRKRRLALAVHEANLASLEVETPQVSEFIAYDEPDTHLDYNSQRALFDILERQARLPHVQIAVATHSLNFIDRVALESIVHFRLGDDLRTDVEMLAGDQHEEEVQFLSAISYGLGLRNSVLLDERAFLVVEGETEEVALPELFRVAQDRSLTAAGITLLNTRGSGSIGRLVELLVERWKRNVVMLADSDARERLSGWWERLGLEEGSRVFFLGEKEFEDAFGDEVWLRVLEESFPTQDGGGAWGLDEVSALREGDKAFSKGLVALVRRRCRDHRIGKPDLGLALTRGIDNASRLPSVLQQCFNAVSERAGAV